VIAGGNPVEIPASASAVIFATIEDETGHANLIVWPSLFERQRRTVLSVGALACGGKVQGKGDVIHLVAANRSTSRVPRLVQPKSETICGPHLWRGKPANAMGTYALLASVCG
jgi:DNA polymerase III alpha subunit